MIPLYALGVGTGLAPAKLPWNTTRSMADVWGLKPVRTPQKSKEYRRVTGSLSPAVTPAGKIAYAGYDKSEMQFKRHK